MISMNDPAVTAIQSTLIRDCQEFFEGLEDKFGVKFFENFLIPLVTSVKVFFL